MKETIQNLPEIENQVIPVEAVFYPEKATLLLNIDNHIPNLDFKRAEAQQLGLTAKEEFHFTIIGSDTGEEILELAENLDEQARTELTNKIRELNESTTWEVALKNDFYYIQKEYNDPDPNNPEVTIPEKRQSIIQMAKINGLEEFYKKLNSLLGKQFATPLPHITLYTTSTREDKKLRGIGIYSEGQFQELGPKKI